MKPPTTEVLEAFNIHSNVKPKKLEGGQGTTYLANDVVLKPDSNVLEAAWVAEIFSTIEQVGFRVSSPIATVSGDWTFDGWTAWEYLEGQTLKGEKYQERLAASQAFHKALANIPRPSFLDKRNDAWSQADRIVWENASWQPHPRIQALYEKLLGYQTSLDLSEQVIHGDIAGNMLYQANEPIVIIDFSPYWRPAAYAEALLYVDSIMWEKAPWSMVDFVVLDETFIQLMLRAVMRRLVEVDRHFALNRLPNSYLNQVKVYENFTAQFTSHLSL